MRKVWKRAVAALCIVAMLAGCVISEIGPIATKAADSNVTEFSIFKAADTAGEAIDSSGVPSKQVRLSEGIQLPEQLQAKSELELYIRVSLEGASAIATMKDAYVELANNQNDGQELYWHLTKQELVEGENVIRLSLSSGTSYRGNASLPPFDITAPIKHFRIHQGGAGNTTESGTIKLHEVVLRENVDKAGLEFGADDTHLQLSNSLTAAPEGIEASIKKDENSGTVESPKEWLVRSGASTSWSSWENLSTNTKEYGTVAIGDEILDDDVMEAGTKYVKVDLTSGKTFNLQDYNLGIDIPDKYEQKDLVLTFWYYTSTGVWPNGKMRLTSNGGTNTGATNGIGINLSDYVDGLKANSWNKISIPLEKMSSVDNNKTTIDWHNINYFVWWSQTGVTEAMTMGLSDIKIEVMDEIGWTLLAADNTLGTGKTTLERAATHRTEEAGGYYNQAISTGKVSIDEATSELPVGTKYIKINSYKDSRTEGEITYSGGRVGFVTPWKGLQARIDEITFPEGCKQEDLTISFWLYVSNGKMPTGGFQATSAGWSNGAGLRWWNGSNFTVNNIKVGWNHIQLNLGSYDNTPSSGFDFTNLNYFEMYTEAETPLTEDAEFRVTDIRLLYTPQVDTQVQVTTAEIANPTAIADKSMIFSNTNVSGETPYALYVNEAGYPALLWGNTEYTLNYNVCTGNWTDIKVVRNAENYIEFYIDGELKGTSSVVEEDVLSNFNTAHRIAADGTGAQIFNGSIKKLTLYSDNACTSQLGDWNLIGGTQYVTVNMPDSSDNSNHAVYRGSRAEDWKDFDAEKEAAIASIGGADENYWSMVFIPDIQNLAQTSHGFDQTWYKMAQWIADNVATENIKHVIGAGDNTWNNVGNEYTIAQTGFDKFKDIVSWSNLSGNHEYTWDTSNRANTLYDIYFGEEYIKSSAAKNTYVGYYDEDSYSRTENSYYRFNVNGVNWMILQLEYHPRLSVLQWAKDIANQYPADNVILATHGYINGQGNYFRESNDFFVNGDGDDYLAGGTAQIWETLNTCTNIKMILCGHSASGTGSIAMKKETNSAGEKVPALMINAQDLDLKNSGAAGYFPDKALGMLSIFRFSEDGKKASVQLFCPEYGLSFDPMDPTRGARDTGDIALTYVHETFAKKYTKVTAGTAPTTVEDGYVFAGWYKEETCKTPLEEGGAADVAYAKFVDADVLTVKAQVKNEKLEGDGEPTFQLPLDKTDIRFVTTVDTLRYKNVGFKIVIKSTTTMTTERTDTTNEVSRKIYAIGNFGDDKYFEEYTPAEKFSSQSQFFKTFTIWDVKAANYNTPIEVTPYWITLDGTYVYGTTVTKTISDPAAVAN